ncbi:MAG: PAC2 family protein [Myxococcota bacterium]|nr:PAC2 family protein [Myxococcota bacterium]
MTLNALRFDVQPAFEDPVLMLAFEGWNDAGESATGAVRFLSDSFQSAPLGRIDCQDFYDFTVRRPNVRIGQEGVREIAWPDFELRFAAIPDRPELVFGVGAEPHLRWRSFCDLVVRAVDTLSIRRAVLLGGFLADVLYSRPVRVSGFSSEPSLLGELAVEPSDYEGPTGITGVLADRLRAEGLEVTSLWAGLPHYITVTPNPRGTLALVQTAAELLDLPVDRTPLERDSAAFERNVSELVAADPALSEYVKELKRREFAQ